MHNVRETAVVRGDRSSPSLRANTAAFRCRSERRSARVLVVEVQKEGTPDVGLQARIRAEGTRCRMRLLNNMAMLLLVVGGLNWGLWGVFQYDLVAALLGGNTALLSKWVYGLIGLAAVYHVLWLKPIQMRWNAKPLTT